MIQPKEEEKGEIVLVTTETLRTFKRDMHVLMDRKIVSVLTTLGFSRKAALALVGEYYNVCGIEK